MSHQPEDYLIHPAAIVETASIGKDTRVWAFTHIMKGATIGARCNIGEHCFIEQGVSIGDFVVVKNGVSIWEGVTVEDDAFVGPHAVFTNDLAPRHGYPKSLVRTLIKKGASIGAGGVIVAGVTIGRYAMVGAGAVVTRNVPNHALVRGNPARQNGWVCICGLKLQFDGKKGTCSCGMKYELEKDSLKVL